MGIGLIGRKVGMTQVFQDDGTMVGVSVLAIEPNTVTRLRTVDRDGYTAVQLGTDTTKKVSKPTAGQLAELPKGAAQAGTFREFRVEKVDDYSLGQTISVADVFAAGDIVDVTGVSKGDERATIKKLRVVRTDPERNLLLVKGSLPGARGSLILVKKA